jgi:hypothetical protein
MSVPAEEGEFPTTADSHETQNPIDLTQIGWRLDGLLTRTRQIWELIVGQVVPSKVTMTPRGPDPDEGWTDPTDLEEQVSRLVRREIGRRATAVIGGDYHEKGSGGGKKWESYLIPALLAIIGTLIVSGIIGLIVMYGQLTSLNSRMDHLERLVEPRYRGTGP